MRRLAPSSTAFIFTSRSRGNLMPNISETVKNSRAKPLHCFWIMPMRCFPSMDLICKFNQIQRILILFCITLITNIHYNQILAKFTFTSIVCAVPYSHSLRLLVLNFLNLLILLILDRAILNIHIIIIIII